MNARVLGLAFAVGCAKTHYDTPLPPDGLPRGTPSAADLARFEAASAWSLAHGGQDLVVVQGDEVVFARAAPGYDPLRAHHLYSGTKSFACALVQAAIAAGDVTSLDEKVADAYPPLAAAAAADPRKRDITVRQLLQFTSGLDDDGPALTRDGLRVDQQVADKPATAAGEPMFAAPGDQFRYGSEHLWVLSGWFRARTGQDPLDYLDAHVFAPIGFAHADWIRDPNGNPALAYGAWTTAGQWARYGMLLRDDGAWNGEQVLPPGAVAECTTGSAANPAYGLTFWLNHPTDADIDPVGHTLEDDGRILYAGASEDVFVAAGALDQRLYVIPDRDLVIARLGEGDWGFRDRELLARALDGVDPPGGCDHAGGAGGGAAVLAALGVWARRPRPPARASRTRASPTRSPS